MFDNRDGIAQPKIDEVEASQDLEQREWAAASFATVRRGFLISIISFVWIGLLLLEFQAAGKIFFFDVLLGTVVGFVVSVLIGFAYIGYTVVQKGRSR
jgi:hypothetical protein